MSGLTGSAVAGAVGRVTLERFLPRQVLDAALVDPLALLGPPRTIDATVLISDLRGFTALSETLPPAKLLAFLSVVQGELADAVRANGGVVDKFMGDGMLAVFGAPETDPEHARHALDAAKAALAAIVRLNAERAQLEQGPIRLGIGIHSGPVVVGCLGYGQRLEFTVIGSTVNTASRLESLTKEKAVEVLVSGETARRAPDAGLRAMGSVNVRGLAQPLDVFTLGG
jgi:class 3 adenylate cyclase